MSYNKQRDKYVDLKVNGRLFPTWFLANFKKYKLPEIDKTGDRDPCARNAVMKKELKQHQLLLSKYLDYRSPYRDILVYHGLGTGKTVTTINIYNVLYNYTPGWNVYVLLKASLQDHPWMKDIKTWLSKDEYEFRFQNIIFVHYDSPFADREFIDATKNADSSKKSMYIIEEAHNFIRNVYTNISSKQGKRAQVVYDYIIQDKKDNPDVRVILLTGTPAINTPYELALLFNLLRPGSFPKSESQFNQIYLSLGSSYQTINEATKNMFQRRIMGLVSYYKPIEPGVYATSQTEYVDVPMSEYQSDIYSYYEEIEDNMAKRKKMKQGGQETYKSYTRQSCNFVFPAINQWVMGEGRPRPNKFRISERDAEKVNEGKGKLKAEKNSDKLMNVQKYLQAMETYLDTFTDFLQQKQEHDVSKGRTIMDDVAIYKDKYNGDYEMFFKEEHNKSYVYDALHMCSAKMVQLIFNIFKSKGPVIVYSNYVLMEGLQIFKIYLKQFGYSKFVSDSEGNDNLRYAEYHGGIEFKDRSINLENYNRTENKYGKLVKILMISPAGSEGISCQNVRQVHLMEPYWHEVRMAQIIGRAIRQCSHKDLPLNERHVDVFRYKSTRMSSKQTTDQYIEELARSKDRLIQSFLDTVQEVAIDCAVFKAQNMATSEYKCFQFNEPDVLQPHPQAAYKEDINDDIKMNNGSNSTQSITVKIKVMKIKAVKIIKLGSDDGTEEPVYSKIEEYWLNTDSGVIYDADLHYAVGQLATDDDNNFKKLDQTTYIIDRMIYIPMVDE
jgi:superfamily II DNA or RNA helicase